jgi:hypothetical protein
MDNKDQSPIPPEIIAVIAAAVAVTINKPHRVLQVKQAAYPVPHFNVWAYEGRAQLALSHRIR